MSRAASGPEGRMTLAPGARLGPYEITAKLGEGGMGEVCRATDSKLKREVAIKVLPEDFAADAGAPRALRARGAAPRPAPAPEHRLDLRPRGVERRPRPRHGARARARTSPSG